jgi:hypothetical protein
MGAGALYQRILKLLRAAVHVRELPLHELDATLGRSRGYLSRIFSGKSTLRLPDFLRLVEVLEIPCQELLGPLVTGSQPQPAGISAEELLERLAAVAARRLPPSSSRAVGVAGAGPVSRGDLAPLVEETVRRVLAERGFTAAAAAGDAHGAGPPR